MRSYFNADCDERKINGIIIGSFHPIIFHRSRTEWEWETSYCCKCVNVSSRLNQAGVRRIINSRHDWPQSVFQYVTTWSARTDQRAAVLCGKIMGRRRKMWTQNRGGGIAAGEFAVLFIRSSRFLAIEQICQVGRFYGRFTRPTSWKLIVERHAYSFGF